MKSCTITTFKRYIMLNCDTIDSLPIPEGINIIIIISISYILSTVGTVIWKKIVCVSGSKVKKTFSMIFLLSHSTSKKHGLDPDQRSKNHFTSGFKGQKKHFLWIFYFRVLHRKNMVLVGFKGQKKHFLWFFYFHDLFRKIIVLVGFKGKKNIFYFQFEYRKNTDCSSSEVMGRIAEAMIMETSRCYPFAEDHIDWKVNQSDCLA
jgi:hypothetical protein